MRTSAYLTTNAVNAPVARHPALVLAALVAAGITLAYWSDWAVTTWLWMAGFACVGAVLIAALSGRRTLMSTTLSVVAVAITLGGARYSIQTVDRPNPGVVDLAASGRIVELFGVVDGSPQKRLSGWRVPLALTSVRTRVGTVPLESTVLLTTRRSLGEMHHGDLVRLPARLVLPHSRRNPGGFDYAEHLFNRGIDALARPAGEVIRLVPPEAGLSLHRIVDPVRQWLRDVFTRHLSKRPRTLVLGFLIGEIGELPPTVLNTVRDAGALHLLAVSGANVWLVVGIVLLPLRLLGVHRWPRALIVLVVVLAFSVLARNEPSVVRASLMVASLIIGSLWFRPVRPLNAVGISALIILVHSPTHLFQPGFQLSFAAVISIIVVVESMRHWARQPRTRWGRWLLILCVSTAAATIATAPVIAWHFAEVPVVTLPANLVLVPLVSVCVYLGIGVLLVDPLWSAAAGLIAVPLEWLLDMCLTVAGIFASLPVSVLRWPNPSLVTVAMLYGGLLAAFNWRHRYRFVRPAAYAAGLVIALSLVTSTTADQPPWQRLALLDAGNTRLAIRHDTESNTVVVYTDDPHVSYDLREWVIEPYLRESGLPTAQLAVQSWLTLSRDDVPVSGGSRHIRYLSPISGLNDRDRYWADRIGPDGAEVTFVRSVPSDTGVVDWIKVMGADSDVLILPADCPAKALRSFLSTTSAAKVVLYGNSIPHRHAAQWFDDLRTHYPDIEFWATPIHGGITIEWHTQGLKICPTISNSAWHDPSGR
ncbi:MAG: hypothetical protein Kow0074_09020 [Candidatus Zixiibacteriota bacterium]